MIKPTEREKKLFQDRKIKKILAIDEVGRGALAGPFFVAGLIVSRQSFKKLKKLPIADSKKLSPNQRQSIFAQIKNLGLVYKIIKTEANKIDRFGLSQAWLDSINQLIERFKPDLTLIDGPIRLAKPIRYESWIKGDEKIISIGASSIVAKVERDSLMKKLAVNFPSYRFEQNKGYGTSRHIAAIKKFGLSPIHRQSFRIKKSAWIRSGKNSI
ncbi:MAG: ribonuclease HII [Patescibacteria group bacterium]|nr:ribonuclease HII [Patescibacteria group bacterium]MCL5257916.1 ribonuclease HII [Patescibacteria group bacterium]